MNNKKVVLFDIDYTLFNAQVYRDLFLRKIFDALSETDWDSFLAIEEEIYRENKKKFEYFNPKPFLEELERKYNKQLDIEMLNTLFTDEEIIKQSLYEETIAVLEALARQENLILGIFSAGRESMQIAKIHAVAEFLQKEHIHIFAFSKKHALEDVLNKYESYKIFLVDDILEILYNAKKLKPDTTTIWIKRGPYKNNPEIESVMKKDNFFPDHMIENLKELREIIH